MKMPRVLNKYRDEIPPGAVSIMRPGLWGNLWRIGRDGTRKQVIDKYRRWLRDRLANDAEFSMGFKSLASAPALVCCCKPAACHGDVMVEFLEKLTS